MFYSEEKIETAPAQGDVLRAVFIEDAMGNWRFQLQDGGKDARPICTSGVYPDIWDAIQDLDRYFGAFGLVGVSDAKRIPYEPLKVAPTDRTPIA